METAPTEKILEWVEGTKWSVIEAEELYYEIRQGTKENNSGVSSEELDAHASRCTRLSVRNKRPPSEIAREKASRRDIMRAIDPEATGWKVICPSSDCPFAAKIEDPTEHVFCPECGEQTFTYPIRNKDHSVDAMDW